MAKLLSCGRIALLAVCLFPAAIWAQVDICDTQTTWGLFPVPVGQDPLYFQCGVVQFRAGESLGWAASIVHNGRTLNVAELNDWIRVLYQAAHAIQGGNACCSKRNLAWPSWYNMQEDLYRLADQAVGSCGPNYREGEATCETFCMGAWIKLNGMLAAYGNVLGPMELDKPEGTIYQSFSACDPNYFKLGFRLAYAHFRLQVGDRDESDKQVREAIRHVQMLEDCRPWSGYCVRLWHPQLIRPSLYLLLDRGRLSTPDAAIMINRDVMEVVDRTLFWGNGPLDIDRSPGVNVPERCCERWLAGLSRASQRMASMPQVVVPPSPAIRSISPAAPTQSDANQTITVNGANFQAGLSVTALFPGGGSTILSGSQVSPISFQLIMALNSEGTWGIRVNNPDRQLSNMFYFTVGAPAPSPTPSPPQIYNLSGTWKPERGGGSAMSVITGGTTRYTVSGTGTNPNNKNQGTLVGDGSKFEGSFKDLPDFCCGREGYVWLEVIDRNTFTVKSVWWKPGEGSKEKPQLTYGWSTWKRSGQSGTATSEGKPGGEGGLEARKKALGMKLDEVRKAGNWHPDHHYQVGTFLHNCRTLAQLNAVETLMHQYAGCYQTLNAERARVAEAQKAGRYQTPGDRIGDLDRAQTAFNQCVATAHSRYVAARSR